MDGFCHLYLLVILLMRSGDIETNPGPNTPESTVSEEEYLLLSELIGSSNYKRVGIRLGIPFALLSGIKKQSNDYSDHFMQVFMRWRDEQPPDTNIRSILAQELQTCRLGELSGRLLDGSLLSKTPSKPSVIPSTSHPHEPLSPELVQRCAEEFKFKYRTSLCKIRADPLNPDSLMQFEDMYTNLVLEEEHGRKKRLLKYSDLLKLTDNGKFPRRLLVQGEAGAGKTTLCAKIAWDWINGKHFQEFIWVIVVPLREAKKYTIGEIAKSYLTHNNPATSSQLTEYMHLNSDKVFILFDGLDEFPGNVAQRKEDGSQSTGHKSQSHQSSHSTGSTQHQAGYQSTSGQKKRNDVSSVEKEIEVGEILRSEKLKTCPVMVTTRPWKAKEIRWNDRLRELYTFLHVEGFNKQNVAVYIQKYFADDKAKANGLIQFANDNDVISENMAPYPIYIAMLCLMWQEIDEEKRAVMKSLQTFSQIFKEIFVFLKEHYAMKLANRPCSLDESLNEHLTKVNKFLEPIASLALDGLLKNTLVFQEGDFEHCPESMKTACRVGVLSEENRIIVRRGRHNASNPRMQSTVFFPHKLFQEYMAGIHLASLYETDNREYNRLMEEVVCPRKEEFRYLLYFTASQNQTVGISVMTQVERSFPGVQQQIKSSSHEYFLVDVAFECHDTHAATLIKDKALPPDSTLQIRDCILSLMTAHTIAGYAFIQPDIVRLEVSRQCGPTVSRDVAEMICSLPSLREVILIGELHENFYTTLAAQGQFSQVRSLSISGVFSVSASPDLAVAFCSMPDLTELTLAHVKDEFYSTLKAMASSMKIQSFTTGNIFGEAFATSPASDDLAVALCTMPDLTKLTLHMVFSDEFYSTLKAMASYMKVQSFTIGGKALFLSSSASCDLAVALCSMPDLTELTFDGVRHDDFFSILTAKASSMKCCFPQILKGNFVFNGTPQKNLESLMRELSRCGRDDDIYPPQTRPRGLNTNVPVKRGSPTSLSVRQAVHPSMFCNQPSTSRGTVGVHQTYHKEQDSMLRHPGYSSPHTTSMCNYGPYQVPSFSPSHQLLPNQRTHYGYSTPCPPPMRSCDPHEVLPSSPSHQMLPNQGTHYGYSTPYPPPMHSCDPHAVLPSSPSHQLLPNQGTHYGDSNPYPPPMHSYAPRAVLPSSPSHQLLPNQGTHYRDSTPYPPMPICDPHEVLPSSPSHQMLPNQGTHYGDSSPYPPPMHSCDPHEVLPSSPSHQLLPNQGTHYGYSSPYPFSMHSCDPYEVLPLSHQITDRPVSNALQLPQTVRSSNGRSERLQRTAPCTQSRVPHEDPEKQPRVVHLCDYSSSDESSTS